MNEHIRRLYKIERAKGYAAKWALMNAKTRVEWDDMEDITVRLRVEWDEYSDIDDLFGDHRGWSRIRRSRSLERERKVEIERIDREGVIKIISEYLDPLGKWEIAHSLWGFIGDDWKDCAPDVMRETIDTFEDSRLMEFVV
jgi:hypothetical protein